MHSNVLVIDDAEMADTASGIRRAFYETDDTSNMLPIKFHSIKKTGLFGNGLKTINKQINSLSNSLMGVENAINEHTDYIMNMEMAFAKEADEIEIPHDFVNTDTRQVNTIDDIYLDKRDGRTVNEGTEQKPEEHLDESTVNKENLENIVTDETQKQELDDRTQIERDDLDNINNEKETEEQIYDDKSSVEKENVELMNSQSNFFNGELQNFNGINDKENLGAMNSVELKPETQEESTDEKNREERQKEEDFLNEEILRMKNEKEGQL